MNKVNFLFVSFFFPALMFAQSGVVDDESDKCGTLSKSTLELHEFLGDKWGYGYEDLLLDLNEWGASEFVNTDFIGESTLGREIYELTITDPEVEDNDKHRIYIHARTHPGEVQSFWVTDEMINILLGESDLGVLLRNNCIFHVVPMYNPDGVELEYPRENANDVDIESNWNTFPHEVEVQSLKARFTELMEEPNPIEIALNMHSAVACKRYFVYHHANGTTSDYAEMEEDFITRIWDYFPDGMEPYTYYVSWTSGTPSHYPESWWWNNHGEQVMALTYEDMNCATSGEYDKTALAMLSGIADYLGVTSSSAGQPVAVREMSSAYPNPFRDHLTIKWEQGHELRGIQVVDLLGRTVYQQTVPGNPDGVLELPVSDWIRETGGNIYLLKLRFADRVESIRLVRE